MKACGRLSQISKIGRMLIRAFFIFIALFSIHTSSVHADEKDVTVIRYGWTIPLTFSTESLASAEIFRSIDPDSLSIKFESGKFFSWLHINHDIAEQSNHFDLSKYPLFILGLEAPNHADIPDTEQREKLKLSADAMFADDDPGEISIVEAVKGTLYTRCGKQACTHFYVETEQAEEILQLFTSGFGTDDVIQILTGAY